MFEIKMENVVIVELEIIWDILNFSKVKTSDKLNWLCDE